MTTDLHSSFKNAQHLNLMFGNELCEGDQNCDLESHLSMVLHAIARKLHLRPRKAENNDD